MEGFLSEKAHFGGPNQWKLYELHRMMNNTHEMCMQMMMSDDMVVDGNWKLSKRIEKLR